jgi:addiction module RelE/StbE family toxin
VLQIYYKPQFIRQLKKLSIAAQNEVIEKIELLKHEENHAALRVHKLHGRLKGTLSFSINYKDRAIFEYMSKNEITLLVIGDHAIYN